MMTREYPPIGEFAVAFAAEYKAFMVANGIKGKDIAARLGRNEGYVSLRVNGKRPLDTDDIDALAALVPGWDGGSLIIELARRARLALEAPAGELVQGRFPQANVDGIEETRRVAKKKSRDRGEDDGGEA